MESKPISSTTPLLLTSGASGRVNALLSLRALKSLILLIKAFILLLLVPFQVFIKHFISFPSPTIIKDEKHMDTTSTTTTSTIMMMNNHQRKSPVVRVPAAMVRRSNNNTTTVVVSGDSDVAARRALAIRRVTHDDEDDGGSGLSVREHSLFGTSRGDTLFTQSWTPVSTQIRGLVVILHGLNEHSGRYNHFAKKLNANGYKVYAMDWIGHGGSDGLHGYVHSLDHPVNDMKSFLEKVLTENPGLPCFCFGHSTGGAIALKTVLDPKIEVLIKGVVLTSPAVRVQPSHPIFGVLAPIVSFLFPKYQFSAANKNGTVVSRDPAALLAKYSDPLVYTGSIRVRTGSEILRISSYLQQHLTRLTTPFLVLHGGDDTVTDPEASLELYEKASSSDKAIKLYKGLLHDILFEPEREVVAQDIIDWLNSRVKV